jgi:preprotein translocase subunit SecE
MSGVQVLQGALFFSGCLLRECKTGSSFFRLLAAGWKQVTKKDVSEGKPTPGGFNPGEFVKETKEEFDKVVWPDRQQLIGESAAVIFMVSLSALLISLVDNLFQWLANLVF